MASTQHTPTELEAAGDLVLPAADELAGRFPLTPNAHPATPEEYNEIMSTLAFGKKFTDHMAHMRWTREGGWEDREVVPYGPLNLNPGASVFHYCQSVFEGIKAYKREDGSVWTFRPGYNAARLRASMQYIAVNLAAALLFLIGVALVYAFEPRPAATDPHLPLWKRLAARLLGLDGDA